MTLFINDSLKRYLEEIAARKPVPGGGSVAAFSGALGASLLEMACNFTIGNEKYKSFEKDVCDCVCSLKKTREVFSGLVDEDIRVYSEIRDAYKSKDKRRIECALQKGYTVSLKICEAAESAMNRALCLCEKCNANLITDIGCGAELLKASFNSALFNAEINLKGITESSFAENGREKIDDLKKEIDRSFSETVSKTKDRMR